MSDDKGSRRYPWSRKKVTMESEHTSYGEPDGSPASVEQVFQGLRGQLLELDPAAVGLEQGPRHPVLWGALVEMGYPGGAAVTIVALADGTTSMYTSAGGGIIGGGFHKAVASATQSFLAALEQDLAMLRPDPDAALPAAGQVIIRALTYTGRMSAEASEDDLADGGHQLSPVFYAAHRVITELRLIDEARQAHR